MGNLSRLTDRWRLQSIPVQMQDPIKLCRRDTSILINPDGGEQPIFLIRQSSITARVPLLLHSRRAPAPFWGALSHHFRTHLPSLGPIITTFEPPLVHSE